MSAAMHPVRRLRLLRDLDQFTLGVAAGRSASWISCVERGRVNPDRETLAKIAAALGVKPSDLIQEETP